MSGCSRRLITMFLRTKGFGHFATSTPIPIASGLNDNLRAESSTTELIGLCKARLTSTPYPKPSDKGVAAGQTFDVSSMGWPRK